MNGNIADPRPLGFGVLAIALWMLSVVHAGIAGAMMGFDPHVVHAFGTVAMLGLLIAGIAAFLRRESWLGFFFLLWSGLFWSSAYGMDQGQMGYGGARYAGWFMMTIALVNFYLWIAAWKSARFGGAISFMVLLLWVAFLCFGLNGFFGFWVLLRVGGAFGLASALVAFYVSAATLATELCPNKRYPGIPERYAGTPPIEPRV